MESGFVYQKNYVFNSNVTKIYSNVYLKKITSTVKLDAVIHLNLHINMLKMKLDEMELENNLYEDLLESITVNI